MSHRANPRAPSPAPHPLRPPLQALAGDQLKSLHQYVQQLEVALRQCAMPEAQRQKALERLSKALICRYDGACASPLCPPH